MRRSQRGGAARRGGRTEPSSRRDPRPGAAGSAWPEPLVSVVLRCGAAVLLLVPSLPRRSPLPPPRSQGGRSQHAVPAGLSRLPLPVVTAAWPARRWLRTAALPGASRGKAVRSSATCPLGAGGPVPPPLPSAPRPRNSRCRPAAGPSAWEGRGVRTAPGGSSRGALGVRAARGTGLTRRFEQNDLARALDRKRGSENPKRYFLLHRFLFWFFFPFSQCWASADAAAPSALLWFLWDAANARRLSGIKRELSRSVTGCSYQGQPHLGSPGTQ